MGCNKRRQRERNTRGVAGRLAGQKGPRGDDVADGVADEHQRVGNGLFRVSTDVGGEQRIENAGAGADGVEKVNGKERRPGERVMTEYGADMLSGLRSWNASPSTEEFQLAYYNMCYRVHDCIPAMIGEQVWNFAEFQTAANHIFRVDGNNKGIFTRDRKPKAIAGVLKTRWDRINVEQEHAGCKK
jgi:hypothetical protein